MSPEQLRALETQSELGEGPIPMVLDTSWVRTGLRYQLANRLVGILHVCLEREVLYDELAAWPVDSERAA